MSAVGWYHEQSQEERSANKPCPPCPINAKRKTTMEKETVVSVLADESGSGRGQERIKREIIRA